MKSDNDKSLDKIKNIASFAKSIIKDSMYNISNLSDWQSLQEIREQRAGQDEWVVELVKSIISSATVFNEIQTLPGQASFLTNYKARADKNQEYEMGLNIHLQGNTEKDHNILVAKTYGGQVEIENNIYTFQKNSTAFNASDVEEAAEKLKRYFVAKYEEKVGE